MPRVRSICAEAAQDSEADFSSGGSASSAAPKRSEQSYGAFFDFDALGTVDDYELAGVTEGVPIPASTHPAAGHQRRRWVVVQPQWGLCNRLRAVVSAKMLAEDLGRELLLDWRPQPGCNCHWDRLVEPVPGLEHFRHALVLSWSPALDAARELLQIWEEVCVSMNVGRERIAKEKLRFFDELHEQHFRSGLAYFVDPASVKWRELRPLKGCPFDRLPGFLQVDCICVRAFNPFYPPRDEDRNAMAVARSLQLNQLTPAQPVSRRLWQLPPGTISVHVRRTDHAKARKRSPDELFLREMDGWCQEGREVAPGVPFSHFFVATDDPSVEEMLRGRYGERVLSYRKRTLDRNAPEGIEDAFVDLLMLAQGAEIIGSFRSSYSSIAALFRLAPLRVIDAEEAAEAGKKAPQKQGAVTVGYREVSLVARDPSDVHSDVIAH